MKKYLKTKYTIINLSVFFECNLPEYSGEYESREEAKQILKSKSFTTKEFFKVVTLKQAKKIVDKWFGDDFEGFFNPEMYDYLMNLK